VTISSAFIFNSPYKNKMAAPCMLSEGLEALKKGDTKNALRVFELCCDSRDATGAHFFVLFQFLPLFLHLFAQGALNTANCDCHKGRL
jgi:hypothetical protein